MELEQLLNLKYRSHPLYDRPDYYDLDYQGYLAEADFYHSLLRRGLDVNQVYVELGAGSGRLLKTPLDNGIRCHAVDPSAPMLEKLKTKTTARVDFNKSLSLEIAKADNFKGPKGETIGVVSFPFNGLLHIYTYEELLRSFRHIANQLHPEGRFALDIMAPAWEVMGARYLDWGRLDERISPTSGETIYTYDCCHFDQETHLMHSKLRFAERYASLGVELFYVQRMWTFQEILGALDKTGFIVEEIYGDVDFSSFEEDSPRLLLVASPMS